MCVIIHSVMYVVSYMIGKRRKLFSRLKAVEQPVQSGGFVLTCSFLKTHRRQSVSFGFLLM